MTGSNGKIEAGRKSVTSTFPTLTDKPNVEVYAAMTSLSNNSTHKKRTRMDGVGDTPEERFWSRVNKDGPIQSHMTTPCWEWLGGLYPNGYGQVTFRQKKTAVHRLSWELYTGFEPKLFILHECDNRKCVNPSHLREGTKKENAQDRVKRGGQPYGEDSSNAELTNEDIYAIYDLGKQGATQRKIAAMYSIDQKHVCDILRGRRWKHLYRALNPADTAEPVMGQPNRSFTATMPVNFQGKITQPPIDEPVMEDELPWCPNCGGDTDPLDPCEVCSDTGVLTVPTGELNAD